MKIFKFLKESAKNFSETQNGNFLRIIKLLPVIFSSKKVFLPVIPFFHKTLSPPNPSALAQADNFGPSLNELA